MKICWDNLERLRYDPGSNRWYLIYYYNYKRGDKICRRWNKSYYYYVEVCKTCRDPFLAQENSAAEFCSRICGRRKNNERLG